MYNMVKKVVLLSCTFIFIILLLASIFYLVFSTSQLNKISGKSVVGNVLLVIEGENLEITIDSPENITYNFSIGDDYLIDLNVSANMDVESWSFDLYDLKHEEKVNDSVSFTPNETVGFVRWQNKLVVKAHTAGGTYQANKTRYFYVYVPNSAPIIEGLEDNIYICENEYLSYYFNITDEDEDVLEVGVIPVNPFYVAPVFTVGARKTIVEIFSGTLNKEDTGVYQEYVYASDGEYADSKTINIDVIEINNAPELEDLGVQTIYSQGDNRTFYHQVSVSDVEDGNENSGNLSFNITFLDSDRLFNISNTGVMNFTASEEDIGVYNIKVCVSDKALENPHQNISLCGSGNNKSDCDEFSLTITDENRPPTITAYSPEDLILNVSGTEQLYFNITKYDPDGTIPDAYWYVGSLSEQGTLKQYDSGSDFDEFTYAFRCGVSGNFRIEAEITDGLENDSVQWNASVEYVECPVTSAPGSAGGSAGKVVKCEEKWTCGIWGVCQNTEKFLQSGLLSGDDYREIKSVCEENEWGEELCGLQFRNCFDDNSCNTSFSEPENLRACLYVEKPDCNDGVKNCHSGSCEVLIDCGGPCDDCPTCSDGIQNQGEEGIDCGGPCPFKCKIEIPKPSVKTQNYLLMIVLGLFSTALIVKLVSLIKIRKELVKYKGI